MNDGRIHIEGVVGFPLASSTGPAVETWGALGPRPELTATNFTVHHEVPAKWDAVGWAKLIWFLWTKCSGPGKRAGCVQNHVTEN